MDDVPTYEDFASQQLLVPENQFGMHDGRTYQDYASQQLMFPENQLGMEEYEVDKRTQEALHHSHHCLPNDFLYFHHFLRPFFFARQS